MSGRLALSAVAIVLLAAPGTGGEKMISKKNLPAPVLQAFEKQHPAAAVKAVRKDVRKEGTFYEIETVDSARSRHFLYQSDGTLTEVEEEIQPADLPRIVLDGLRAKYPSALIRLAERSTRGDHVEYELTITVGRRTMNVVVNAAGKLFKVR
jgi:hypothetical protein